MVNTSSMGVVVKMTMMGRTALILGSSVTLAASEYSNACLKRHVQYGPSQNHDHTTCVQPAHDKQFDHQRALSVALGVRDTIDHAISSILPVVHSSQRNYEDMSRGLYVETDGLMVVSN